MNYHKTMPSIIDPRESIHIALNNLLPIGFSVSAQTENSLTVKRKVANRGTPHPLLGMSTAAFSLEEGAISIDADLNALNRLSRRIVLVYLAVSLVNAVIFLSLWFIIPALRAHGWFLLIPAAMMAMFVVIILFAARLAYARCEAAINDLLTQMAGKPTNFKHYYL